MPTAVTATLMRVPKVRIFSPSLFTLHTPSVAIQSMDDAGARSPAVPGRHAGLFRVGDRGYHSHGGREAGYKLQGERARNRDVEGGREGGREGGMGRRQHNTMNATLRGCTLRFLRPLFLSLEELYTCACRRMANAPVYCPACAPRPRKKRKEALRMNNLLTRKKTDF